MENTISENLSETANPAGVNSAADDGKSPIVLSLLFLPALFAYYEALLRAFCSAAPMSGISYPLMFGLSAGLILSAAAALLPPKAVHILTTAISAAAGIFFAAECLVKNNFQTFMELSSILSGTDGVMSDYGENLVSSIVKSLPAILLFFAPPVVYGIFGRKLRLVPRAKGGFIPAFFAAAVGVIIFLLGRFILISDDKLEQYEREYFFDSSAESFGLLTALRMSAQNSIFGGSADSGFSGFSGTGGFDLSGGSGFTFGDEGFGGYEDFGGFDSSDNSDGGRKLTLGYEPFDEAPAETEMTAETAETIPEEPVIAETEAVTEAESVETPAADIPEENAPREAPAKLTLGMSSIPLEGEAAPKKKKPVRDSNFRGYNVMSLDFDAAEKNKAGAELNEYVKSLMPSDKNAYTGLFAGKNLILICAEAMSDIVIDKELTPTLYRMSHNGIYFSDYYQPTWGGSTSTGEYSFVTGLVPRNGINSMLDIKSNNNYFTLGNQLQRLGYSSCAFHNGTYDFYNRNLTHKNLGYDNYLGFGNGLENYIKRWSDDSVMLDKTLDLYLDNQPFSLYYMSISGHCTYKANNNKVTENLQRVKDRYGNRYKNTTNYYLCYQMELDKALRIVIEKLEAAGIADDTVICITPDHYPYGLEISSAFGNSEDYVTDLYGYKYTTPWEKDHSSWILWSGCLENELSDYSCEISAPTYSLDIVPTLSNLFGLEFDSRLLVGRDVFSGAEAIALWNNYSWKTEKGCYNAARRKFIPNEGCEYDDAYVKRINSIVKNRIYFSGQAVKCDYYGLLFGKDEFTGQ